MSIRVAIRNFRDYVISLAVFLAIDMIWLTVIAKSFYREYLGYIMASKVNFAAALVFYAIFIFGLMFFVINPALSKNSIKSSLFNGILFGIATYATYDLTNLATLKDWPIIITVVDLSWGGFISGITALLSYLVIKKVRKGAL